MVGVEKLKDFEMLGMLRILYILYKNGPMLTSKIQKEIEISNDAYYKARNKLIDLALIDRKMDKYGAITPFKLTSKGMDVAKIINDLITATL